MVTVVSANLHDYTAAEADTPRREAQRELLRALEPDVLCAQELLLRTDDPGDPALDALLGDFCDDLGMRGRLAWSRSGCHVAVLWRPGIEIQDWTDYRHWPFHHTAARARLDVGASSPLCAISSHLSPFDPGQRAHEAQLLGALAPKDEWVIAGLDRNAPGENTGYDPEPYADQPPGGRHQVHQLVWTEQWPPPPGTPVDRRAAAVLTRHGLHDLAPALGVPWTPTSGHHPADPHGLRRVDALLVSESLLAHARDCDVASPATGHLAADLFDHYVVRGRLVLP